MGVLIQEAFKIMVARSADDTADDVCKRLSQRILATLFLASDSSQSKISNVVRDLQA